MRVSSDICERVSHFRRLTVYVFCVIVDEYIPFPMRSTAAFAPRAPVFEANKETVELSGIVPPDHDEMIQFACGAVRTALADQSRSARAQFTMRGSPPLGPMRPARTRLHGFDVVPVADKRLRQPSHFRGWGDAVSRTETLREKQAEREDCGNEPQNPGNGHILIRWPQL